MFITNSRYALVGYFITSYPTRAHGIIVIYLLFDFQLSPREERLKKCTFHPLLQKAVKIDERQISITRSHNMAPGQGRPGGIVEYQYTWKKNRQNTPKYPKFLQIYPKIIEALNTLYPKLEVSETNTYLVVLPFFGIPSNGLSLLSHDNRSQEKATCQFKWKDGWLWIKNLNPHSSW